MRTAGGTAAALVLLASFGARAQTTPPPEPPPPTPGAAAAGAPATPPAATPTTTPPAAAPPPPATPPPPAARPAAPPQPQPPYPYAWPPGYPYAPAYYTPPPGYPYPYAYSYPYPAPPQAAPTPAPAESLTATAPSAGPRVPSGDPQADRGIFLPTAYTHPKGTCYMSGYELVIWQLGCALTDDTQLTATGVPPLGDEAIALVDLTLKTSLHRGRRVRVAALGSASGLVGREIGVMGVGRAGGVVQLCLDGSGRCDNSLSISSNVTLAGAMLMANGVSGIFRMGPSFSIVAELDTLVPLVRDAGEFGGAMAGGGARWHGTQWGLDLALMRVIGHDKPTIPLLALTYRWSRS